MTIGGLASAIACGISGLVLSGAVLAAGELSAVQNCSAVEEGSAHAVQFTTLARDGRTVPTDGLLMRPPGAGPFPAVVLLPVYSALSRRIAFALRNSASSNWGYGALVVDSDSPADPDRRRNYAIGGYSYEQQALDAHQAYSFLAARSDVDSERVALVGYAYGGSSALTANSTDYSAELRRRGKFRAVVAWHPACRDRFKHWDAPVLIVMGERDALNSVAACQRLQARSDEAPGLQLYAHPGAGHNFDAFWERNFDQTATDAGYAVSKEFLRRHLQQGWCGVGGSHLRVDPRNAHGL